MKDNYVWKWTQSLPSGCVAWMAKADWAAVELSVDRRQCEDGPGLAYDTIEDYLLFRNYWPWPLDQPFVTFDSHGMVKDFLPCPHALTEKQIGAMRAVAHEALASAATEPERRTLGRIDERLAATRGAALASRQSGCADLSLSGADEPAHVDRWTQR